MKKQAKILIPVAALLGILVFAGAANASSKEDDDSDADADSDADGDYYSDPYGDLPDGDEIPKPKPKPSPTPDKVCPAGEYWSMQQGRCVPFEDPEDPDAGFKTEELLKLPKGYEKTTCHASAKGPVSDYAAKTGYYKSDLVGLANESATDSLNKLGYTGTQRTLKFQSDWNLISGATSQGRIAIKGGDPNWSPYQPKGGLNMDDKVGSQTKRALRLARLINAGAVEWRELAKIARQQCPK